MLLKDESSIVLSMASKCEDFSIIESIAETIGETSAAIHGPIYTELLRFHKDHGRFPEFAYIAKNFANIPLGIEYDGKYSLDLIAEFLLSLRQEVVNVKAQEALVEKEYSKVVELCGSVLNLDSKLCQYTTDDAVEEYDEMASRPSSGVMSGISELDVIVNGFTHGTMTVIAAPPAMFKTTLALNIAYHSLLCGARVAFISLELQKKNVYFNLLSRHARCLGYDLPSQHIHKALLAQNGDEYNLFLKVAKDFKTRGLEEKLFILSSDDIPSWETPYITRLFEQIDDKIQGGLDAVFIDYIQICRQFSPPGIKSDDFVNNLIGHISQLSKTFRGKGLISFILSQVNRESIKLLEKTDGDRGMSLSSFAEFHALEREAHYGVSLFSSAADKISGNVLLRLIKNRTGATHESPVPIHIELSSGSMGLYDIRKFLALDSLVKVTEESKNGRTEAYPARPDTTYREATGGGEEVKEIY